MTYRNIFQKQYTEELEDASEEADALLRFTKNFRDIEDHNTNFDLGLVEYSLDINQFADLSPEDTKKFTFGHQLPPYEFSNYTVRPKAFLQVTSSSGIPAGPTAVDWNAAGAVGPVIFPFSCLWQSI